MDEMRGEKNDFKTKKTNDGATKKLEINSTAVKEFFDNRIACEWLSTKEAAYFLSVSENALRIMVHRNQVQVFRFGRRLRFRLKDCQALFQMKGA